MLRTLCCIFLASRSAVLYVLAVSEWGCECRRAVAGDWARIRLSAAICGHLLRHNGNTGIHAYLLGFVVHPGSNIVQGGDSGLWLVLQSHGRAIHTSVSHMYLPGLDLLVLAYQIGQLSLKTVNEPPKLSPPRVIHMHPISVSDICLRECAWFYLRPAQCTSSSSSNRKAAGWKFFNSAITCYSPLTCNQLISLLCEPAAC